VAVLAAGTEAKIGLLPIDDVSGVWMEKWTHVLEEMQLRHGPYPSGFTRNILHSEPLPDFVEFLHVHALAELYTYVAFL
jgi:hypothetical protein